MTREELLKDVRSNKAMVTSLSMGGEVRALYPDPKEESAEWKVEVLEGLSISQMVPFAEQVLFNMKVQVPTIVCPNCSGRNLRNCPTCNGLKKVLPSQVSSMEAALSPTMQRYKDSKNKA